MGCSCAILYGNLCVLKHLYVGGWRTVLSSVLTAVVWAPAWGEAAASPGSSFPKGAADSGGWDEASSLHTGFWLSGNSYSAVLGRLLSSQGKHLCPFFVTASHISSPTSVSFSFPPKSGTSLFLCYLR